MGRKTRRTQQATPPAGIGPDEIAPSLSEDDDQDELLTDVPSVVVGQFSGIGRAADAIPSRYRDRPIWFFAGRDAECVGLFERLPESPMTRDEAAPMLDALRAFSKNQNEALQEALGPTDEIRFGFHADASFDDVLTSFEDDGFAITAAIEDGDVVCDDTQEEDDEQA